MKKRVFLLMVVIAATAALTACGSGGGSSSGTGDTSTASASVPATSGTGGDGSTDTTTPGATPDATTTPAAPTPATTPTTPPTTPTTPPTTPTTPPTTPTTPPTTPTTPPTTPTTPPTTPTTPPTTPTTPPTTPTTPPTTPTTPPTTPTTPAPSVIATDSVTGQVLADTTISPVTFTSGTIFYSNAAKTNILTGNLRYAVAYYAALQPEFSTYPLSTDASKRPLSTPSSPCGGNFQIFDNSWMVPAVAMSKSANIPAQTSGYAAGTMLTYYKLTASNTWERRGQAAVQANGSVVIPATEPGLWVFLNF